MVPQYADHRPGYGGAANPYGAERQLCSLPASLQGQKAADEHLPGSGHASSGMGYYVSKGFFDTIPKSLDEAARVDGASRFQVFYKVIMPLSKPIVIYTVLTAFMAPWGDFMFAKYISHNTEVGMNVAVGLQYWISSKTLIATNYTMFCAGGVVVALPVTILFMLLQRYYVEGVTGGAVKG